MRVAIGVLAVLALVWGCRTPIPPRLLPAGDPRPRALLDGWRERVDGRRSLYAVARFAVDARGAGVGGRDLAIRSKQRLWLARPARLRVEVLGFLDTAVAVLATDGAEYALLQADEPSFDSGPVYEGLLWDAARLDLSPTEAVEVILGAPRLDAGLLPGAAYRVGERVRIELEDARGVVRRVVEFGGEGWLRRLEQRGADGSLSWEARWDDYTDLDGAPFARTVALRGARSGTDARLSLSGVELNPEVPPELFRLVAPAAGPDAEGG